MAIAILQTGLLWARLLAALHQAPVFQLGGISQRAIAAAERGEPSPGNGYALVILYYALETNFTLFCHIALMNVLVQRRE